MKPTGNKYTKQSTEMQNISTNNFKLKEAVAVIEVRLFTTFNIINNYTDTIIKKTDEDKLIFNTFVNLLTLNIYSYSSNDSFFNALENWCKSTLYNKDKIIMDIIESVFFKNQMPIKPTEFTKKILKIIDSNNKTTPFGFRSNEIEFKIKRILMG